jgi:hypothetical protein
MWFLYIFGRALLGMWRLMIGLFIGLVLYVYMFWVYKDTWQALQDWGSEFMRSLLTTPWTSGYLQWSTLLHLDDKLVFALYILAGRIIWLMLEGAFFTFPYWLFRGRFEDQAIAEAREHLRRQRDADAKAELTGLTALQSQLGERDGVRSAAADRL